MYLKQLDTIGFKSFAERIKVEFVPGVTAVVGPNGSGKSNITDAIRWVLGEQSARSLRGAKMEDIIFQGSESRRALNVAEVTLVLDNSDNRLPVDYQEVSVTRRVYRSGESEFLMNKQPCRLKDITELFMDSGLGREAFSIISQGKVEEILSSKSEERRVIFEEAAGVLKYKNRKKQAEYKLAETQENLNRVEDIIYEIDGQLEPLAKQASIAKEYLSQKERLTNVEVGLLAKEIEQLNDQWQASEQELTKMRTDLKGKQQWIETHEQKSTQLKQEVQQADEQITKLQETLLVATQELENLEGNKKIFHERLQHFHENKTNLERDIADTLEKKEALLEQLQQEQQILDRYKQENQSLTKQINTINEQLKTGKNTIEEDLETLKSDYIELLNEQAAKRNEKNSIQQQLEKMEGKKNVQSTKWQHLYEERSELVRAVEQAEAVVDRESKELQEVQESYQQTERKVSAEDKMLDDMQQKLYKGYQMLENLKSKKEMLEDLKEDFQGFYFGVKEVLKAREQHKLSGIHGAIPELIEFGDQLVDAMETALGAQAQHVVVDNEKSAREAIQWLKRTNKGRATFLPINAMKPKQIPANFVEMLKQDDEFVGVAVDLIQFDSTYQSVMGALLGNVIISKTLEGANRFAQQTGRRYRIVTLDGDVVNPGGSMSGGAKKKNNQSLFTRDRELKTLTKKYKEYQVRVTDYEKQLQTQKDSLAELRVQKDTLYQKLDGLRMNYQKHHSEYKESKLSLEHLNDQLSIYDQDKMQQEQDRKLLEEQRTQIDGDLESLHERLTTLDQKIETLTDQLQNFEAKEEGLKDNLQRLQVQQAELKSQLTNQKEKVAKTESEMAEYKEIQSTKEQQLQQLIDVKNSQQTEEEIEQQIEDKRQQKQSNQEALQQLRDARSASQQNVTTLDESIRLAQKEEYDLQQNIQAIEISRNRLDLDLDNRLQLLENEYSMTFEKAKADYPAPDHLENAKEQVKLIKKSIEELGTVNIGAIEEYDRIKERHEFLTSQQTDLVEAKRTLYEIIAEMDEEMTRRFDETFSQIKEEFTVVFQRLFGGGHAELKLTDPNQLLETGVDIIAQPPGKKLQQLGLLSGGERALTAIALLFAILRVRPVPFCVLDEVEAALDEANVARFAQYLKYYSKHTQFIVITHRKGTMEEADVLYGVTMQESGVSRLVSVKLEEAPELLEA
ncbi:chromosome segregation protein SMC [Gracilibacillus caseinilyticus]|uniref:Chromosome partition protein Smc n=1 Tax=Gracilibacillus caseinilyticus TaxID=2932256 RepID=A0ABY4F0F2_9BACI|nr:chromosome segregation protein SMC [Gracilibacillus caseinilyticus]UOQ47906.1 chromosome segregation protein SMC [Gracilibacillus caseinilyticus]